MNILIMLLVCFFQKEEQKKAVEPPLTKPPPLEPIVIINEYSESSNNCRFDDEQIMIITITKTMTLIGKTKKFVYIVHGFLLFYAVLTIKTTNFSHYQINISEKPSFLLPHVYFSSMIFFFRLH